MLHPGGVVRIHASRNKVKGLLMGLPIPEWFDSTQIRDGDGMLSCGGLRPSEVVHLTDYPGSC